MLSADAWLAMCQPSASKVMEPKTMPAAISMTIILDRGQRDHESGLALVLLQLRAEVVVVVPPRFRIRSVHRFRFLRAMGPSWSVSARVRDDPPGHHTEDRRSPHRFSAPPGDPSGCGDPTPEDRRGEPLPPGLPSAPSAGHPPKEIDPWRTTGSARSRPSSCSCRRSRPRAARLPRPSSSATRWGA